MADNRLYLQCRKCQKAIMLARVPVGVDRWVASGDHDSVMSLPSTEHLEAALANPIWQSVPCEGGTFQQRLDKFLEEHSSHAGIESEHGFELDYDL